MSPDTRKHKMDVAVLIITLILMVLGVIIIYAIGPMRANFLNSVYGISAYSENSFFIRQVFSVAISLIAIIFVYKDPFRVVRKYSKYVILIGLFLCILLLILHLAGSSLAKCELGGCRWYNLGFISFQPAEILKLGAVLYFSDFLARKAKEGNLGSNKNFWIPFGIVSVTSLLLVVVVQKDLGTGVSILAIILATLWMSGISQVKFWGVVALMMIAGLASIIFSPHRIERILTFSDSAGNDSYHIDNALIAIGSGGFAGVGVGNSVQATGYLPESINDSVFAVMGETFGFAGLMLVVACFVILLNRLLKISELLPNKRDSLVVVGVFAWILTHVVVNISAMTGLMPLTGITLPLLSYGGTSMVFISMAIGIVLQLSCHTVREKIPVSLRSEK